MDQRPGQGSWTVEDPHFLRLLRCELAALPCCLPMTEKHNFTITLTYGTDIYLQSLDHGGKSCQKSSTIKQAQVWPDIMLWTPLRNPLQPPPWRYKTIKTSYPFIFPQLQSLKHREKKVPPKSRRTCARLRGCLRRNHHFKRTDSTTISSNATCVGPVKIL